MSDLMTVAIEAAREAGAFLHSRFRRALTIETKEDRSLVTDVDREAERLIVERIASSFPGHDVLAEERGRRSQGSDHCWIIDPMDGTHNYFHDRLKGFYISEPLTPNGQETFLVRLSNRELARGLPSQPFPNSFRAF
jgi:myo-inositol-1(or 4)-monophosphatase